MSNQTIPLSRLEIGIRFALAMKDWAKSGFSLVTKNEHYRRYDICLNCNHFANHTCDVCKCFCWLKTKLANQKCPLLEAKW